ncbi:MAG: MBL fold metallo-hydrolase [Rhodothermales bacterium]|nr:MBL fold metallo-hydrolase [Rhodothermales bacterium]
MAELNNNHSVEVELLGTGTSTGIPVIGCDCAVCTSSDPRNHRLRCSAWVQVGGLSIVIDTSPDFRFQAMRAGIKRVDAVLYTHHHFDHVAGLDDTRPYFFDNRNPIPCYLRSDTADLMADKFRYVFKDRTYPGVPELKLHRINGPFSVHSRYEDLSAVEVIPIDLVHGLVPINGYRIGRFAYLTDTNQIPESSFALLADLDVLVVDALRHGKHPTHYTIEEAVDVANRVGARKTYFTHMTHLVDHQTENDALPDGIELAYDGLKFIIEED